MSKPLKLFEPVLIGLSGFAGAGKTTAIEILEGLGVGARVYMGSVVMAEVSQRGMPSTSEAEREVREELRAKGGMDAIARLAAPKVQSILGAGQVALLDAVYCEEERRFFESNFGVQLICLGIQVEMPIRVERLAKRLGRSLTADELTKRDSYELKHLCLGDVMSNATEILSNNGTLDDLKEALRRFLTNLPHRVLNCPLPFLQKR